MPYLWFAITNLLKAEMEANCTRIKLEADNVGEDASVELKGYARWVYIGTLSCGDNVIDYSDETGREAAIRTQMKVCYEENCTHAAYCDASRFLMTNRRGDMTNFLKAAQRTQQRKNEEATSSGVQDADHEVAAAICSGVESYVSNRCSGRGRKTNKQRRKMSIACGYLFNDSQLKIKGFVKRAMRLTGFSRAYIKSGMKKYKQNRARARRTSESNEVTQERSDSLGSRRWIYDWFHEECPLVELNKDRPAKLKGRKSFKKDGHKLEKLYCEHHLLNGNKAEVAQTFLESAAYKDRQSKDPSFKMCAKTVEKSICACMKQSNGCDCTCDKCAEITALLEGLRGAYGKVSANFCSCSACASDSVWRTSLQSKSTLRAGVMVCGKKKLPKDMKLPYEQEPPAMYCLECSLPKTIGPVLKTVLCDVDVKEKIERCRKCGFHNIKPPDECKMWRDNIEVNYLARVEQVLSHKSDLYELKFVGTKTSFRSAALKLRELLYDWLWHIWIKQSTAHWHKFKIETFPKDTIVVVWDYANRNEMAGPSKSTCERDPKMGCHVAMVLYNPTERSDAESETAGTPRPVMCDYWRSFSSAKDSAEWNKLMLSEIIVHYSGKQPVKGPPVVTPAGGWQDPQVSRENLRAGQPLPEGAVGRSISFGAVPHLDRVIIFSDGKTSTYKGGPNFGMAVDVRERFGLKEVLLCFGQTAHMSGPQDSAGKQPHTMAMAAVKNREILSIYSAQEMYNFCVARMPEPSWIKKKQPAPLGPFGGNGAYIWGFYNDGSSMVAHSDVPGVAKILANHGGYVYKGIEASSCAYSFSSNRPIHPPRLAGMTERPPECREMEIRLVGGYCTWCVAADKIGFGTWRGPLGIGRKKDARCTCFRWTRSRFWTAHMSKTPQSQHEKDKQTAKTARKNEAERKRIKVAKAVAKAKAEWIHDFSEMESGEDSCDDDSDEEPVQEDSDENSESS